LNLPLCPYLSEVSLLKSVQPLKIEQKIRNKNGKNIYLTIPSLTELTFKIDEE